jgi:hypothetical protein
MRRIRIEREAPVRDRSERYAALPLDPRDPDVVRAKRAASLSVIDPRRIIKP